MRLLVSTLILITCLGLHLKAQVHYQRAEIKSMGIPPMTSYGAMDHGFSDINFNVIIGDDGRVYFGNYKGILVFDGVNWTQLTLPNEGAVYGLTKSKDGRIYVGAVNEIGYVDINERGDISYTTLMDRLGKADSGGFTSRPFIMDEQIICVLNQKTVILEDSNAITIDNPPATVAYEKIGNLLLAYNNEGIYQLIEKRWVLIKNVDFIDGTSGSSNRFIALGDRILALTKKGLFDFESEQEIETPRAVKNFLANTYLVNVDLLFDRYIVVSTFNGILILDIEGNLIQLLDKSKGLPDNFVFRTSLDPSGILWVATYNGIAAIDLFSPATIFDERLGVQGVLKDVQLIDDELYLCTMSGLFREKWSSLIDPFGKPSFQKISSVIAHGMIRDNSTNVVLTERQSNILMEKGKITDLPSSAQNIYWSGFKYRDSDDIILGSFEGDMIHYTRGSNGWQIIQQLDPIYLGTELMVEGSNGDIWVSSINEGIFKLNYNKQTGILKDQKKYGQENGLPSNLNNMVFSVYDEPSFATTKGIYAFDSITNKFLPDPRFSEFVDEKPVAYIAQQGTSDVFYFTEAFYALHKTSAGYDKISFPSIDFSYFPPERITIVDSSNVFLSSVNAFLHFNPSLYQIKSEFNVNFASLSLLDRDSTLFGGFGSLPDLVTLDYDNRSLRIKFAATSLINLSKNRYKWRLKGFDEEWSSWSHENQKDYTNLPHGTYTFQVIGRNVHGRESPIASINIAIATPWYFTIWAYTLYLTALGFLIWAIVKLYTNKLRLDRNRLEEIVSERTIEVNQQRDKLIQLDDLKSRFFLNLSHELRTPLTLSMGTVSQTLKEKYGPINKDQKQHLSTSLRNSERLIKMINEILDISKLESGKMELQLTLVNIAKVVNRISELFNSKFHGKQITFNRLISSDSELLVDVAKVETIIVNLLSNAFKFTPDQGQINITLTEDDSQILISIQDNGVGIPEADLPYVFDRFYQVENSASQSGTGIGLALCKELMELHHGSIKLQSKPNDTRFILVFRKGQEHFTGDQIANLATPIEENEHSLLIDASPRESSNNNTETQNEALTSGGHILIVEDNPELKDFLIELLSDTYHVSHVGDGQQALDFLHKTHPDLILSDYMMPVMDGLEMTKVIKQTDALAQIPLIFLTARAEERDKISVLNLGVDDYLFKPFNPDELSARVRNLLQRQQQRQDFIEETIIDSKDIEWKEFSLDLKASVDAYIADHLKEEITGEQLASATNQSERSLYRKVKANTGLSLMNYVKEYRLREARYFLENGTFKTVSEVSYAVGFNYLSHFTKSYKERFGKQPSEYLE